MTASVEPRDSGTNRYREAERMLWSHYGLSPSGQALQSFSFTVPPAVGPRLRR
jgi:hypothetical protein